MNIIAMEIILIALIVLIALTFTWIYFEHKHAVRRQRKYDKQMAEYDQWKQKR